MMHDSGHRYTVSLTDSAARTYLQIPPQDDLLHVDRVLDILDTVLEIGGLYDPIYEAARVPFDLHATYAGHYGIYYRILETERQVHVYFIEDQRRDPLSRFSE